MFIFFSSCSLDESLILDFSENVTNWFDLEFEGFNPDLMFSEGAETGEEEEKAEGMSDDVRGQHFS